MESAKSDILRQAVDAIVAELRPEEIVLFGSYARNDPQPDSDLDLLVIQSRPFAPPATRTKVLARIGRALMTLPVPKDVLLYTREEVDTLRRSPGHVVARALREGKVLYARP